MLQKMRRRGHLAKRRVLIESSTLVEEHMDEFINVPIPPLVPLESSQARLSRPPEPTEVNIPLDQMAPRHFVSPVSRQCPLRGQGN